MSDIFGFIFSIFTSIFDFLYNFKIYNDITIFHLIVILSLFYIIFSFFIDKKGD